VAAGLGLVGLVLLAILLVTITRMLWRARPTGRPGTTWDVQVESPARLVARGAAVDVPLEVTCNATGPVDVFVSVTQKAG
jgi:hypothetical protein